ncbi:MAG: methyltransferase domain-containing protein [Chloroflexi bacterium]|nr:methyltransferase domain-containing protein [Chloroflexota bacterium]
MALSIIQDKSALGPAPDRMRWDERYRAGHHAERSEISSWVLEQARYFTGGRALDVACGAGRHSLWLASLGYDVDAVDLSGEALKKLAREAEKGGFEDRIRIIQADLTVWRPPAGQYDLVFVVRYLNRDLFPALIAACRSGGLLLYRTFHTDLLRLRPEFNPEHLLEPGELFRAFASFEILAYEERRWHEGCDSPLCCTSSILIRI